MAEGDESGGRRSRMRRLKETNPMDIGDVIMYPE